MSASHSPPALSVYNTLTRRKEPLETLRPGEVRLYVCGPTVYSWVHIGNARTFTIFDVVVRYLRHRGYRVSYVRNYTDVDDKIINAAREAGEDPTALAERYIRAFEEDAAGLGLISPDVAPRVTEVIPEILTLIQELHRPRRGVRRGRGRLLPGLALAGVRAALPAQPRRAARRRAGHARRAEARAARLRPLEGREAGRAGVGRPVGRGRPGWHIECSAMSVKYLGRDLRHPRRRPRPHLPPPRERDRPVGGRAPARRWPAYWMHAGFLDLENAKMSKSLGNVVRLRDALAKVDGEALRLFFLSSHYRNGLAFSDEALADAEKRMEYFYETLQRVDERLAGREVKPGPLHGDPDAHLRAFEQAMDDDFNTAGALAALSGLFGQVNEFLDRPPVSDWRDCGPDAVRPPRSGFPDGRGAGTPGPPAGGVARAQA